MVTHNMQQALDLGNRLIMMDKGQIILEVGEEEKKDLTIAKLMDEFQRIRGEKLTSDRALLSVLNKKKSSTWVALFVCLMKSRD